MTSYLIQNPVVFGSIAAVVAALIAGISAYVTARVKADSDRRLSLGAAHRDYRVQLADSHQRAIVGITRDFERLLKERPPNYIDLLQACADFSRTNDRPMTGDHGFDAVVADAGVTISVAHLWLSHLLMPTLSGFTSTTDNAVSAVASAGKRCRALLPVLSMATEAYVFDLDGRREAVIDRLRTIEPTVPLPAGIQ